MIFLVMSLLLVLFLAWVIDLLLTEEEVKKWRAATKEFRNRFKQLNIFSATEASNLWFLGLFRAIYSDRFFSRRRIVASMASTLLAMVLVAYIFQIFSMPGFHVLHRGLLSGMVVLTVINFIADYLSLQETYWIMQLSQKRHFFGITVLTLVDFALTTLIYTATVAAIGFLVFSYEAQMESFVQWLGEPDFQHVEEDVGIGIFFGIMAASTFVTSLLWVGFVASAIVLRLLQMASPGLQRLIAIIGASQRPAFAVAGFICATTTVSYASFQAVTWMGSLLL